MADITEMSYFQDWKTVLIPRLQNNQSWSDLFDAISVVFAKNIYSCIEQLRFIRDPNRQDRQVNIQQSKFLGFDYNSELFSDVEYVNLITFLNKYNKSVKGTTDFINFLGWVKNARFKLIQLWANGVKEYSDTGSLDPFSVETQVVKANSLVDGTGTQEWYPTSHVDITYDGQLYDIDESDIFYLFYKCAPINLVLRSISAIFTADTYFLYLRTATGDYSNAHICIPCIFQYLADFLWCSSSRATSLTSGRYLGHSYQVGGQIYSYHSVFFDKQSYVEDVISTEIIVSREGSATNIYRGEYYPSRVPVNYPRMRYEPESSSNHNKGLGLTIEPYRVNYLLNSDYPINRQVDVAKGSYTFSGKGTYRIVDLSTGQVVANVTDGYQSFTCANNTAISIVCVNVPSMAYYQLENGSTPTSYIPTTELSTAQRMAEIVSYNNLYNQSSTNNESTFYIDFSDKKIEENCTLFYIYQSVGTFIRVAKSGSTMILSAYIDNTLVTRMEQEYTGKIRLSISKKKIRLNGVTWSYPLSNGIVSKIVYLGQEQGNNSINGYIESFRFYPVFVE